MKTRRRAFIRLNMKKIVMLVFCALAAVSFAAEKTAAPIDTDWKGKNVAFLGDSITDKIHVGTKKNYWQFLEESLEIAPHVYAINGNTFGGVFKQAQKLKAERPNIDAIIIFAGTNDFNGGVPIGDWYTVSDVQTNANGKSVVRKRRAFSTDAQTFRGRINCALGFLKENFPDAQIVLLTPIHRSYARFGAKNVQPDESFPNRIGLYIDSYVEAVKEAGNVWAVPVIDLNALCGLHPNTSAHAKYFANKDTDRLHPNADGHYRIAKTLARQLASLPANFE